MAYVLPNFKTKKALKAAIAAGEPIGVFEPGLGPRYTSRSDLEYTGIVYLEGPHYPATHTWSAKGQMEAGKLVKVV